MDGFDWYDGLARMTNVTAEITTAARSYRGQRGNRRRRPGRRMAVPRLSVQRKYVRRPASRASSGPRTARPCPSRALSSCGSAPWTKRLANADSIATEARDMALFVAEREELALYDQLVIQRVSQRSLTVSGRPGAARPSSPSGRPGAARPSSPTSCPRSAAASTPSNRRVLLPMAGTRSETNASRCPVSRRSGSELGTELRGRSFASGLPRGVMETAS